MSMRWIHQVAASTVRSEWKKLVRHNSWDKAPLWSGDFATVISLTIEVTTEKAS